MHRCAHHYEGPHSVRAYGTPLTHMLYNTAQGNTDPKRVAMQIHKGMSEDS